MTIVSGDNVFSTARWIVDPTLGRGTHTTIQSAIDDASSGDTIIVRPGTYTEDITLKTGVILVGWNYINAAGTQGEIVGKITLGSAGGVFVANLDIETNGDYCIEDTGSDTASVKFINCQITYNSTGGINLNNANRNLEFISCRFARQANSIKLFNVTACSALIFYRCQGNGSSSTIVADTIAAGTLSVRYCDFNFNAFTTSGTTSLNAQYSTFDGSRNNVTSLTIGGTGTNKVQNCIMRSGTASAVSVGASATVELINPTLNSTNTNPLTGAGVVNFSNLTYSSTGITANTTTQTGYYTDIGKYMATQQPSILVTANAQANVTGDSTQYTVLFANEIFDQGSNFASPTFTAPTTGRYLVCVTVAFGQIASGTMTEVDIDIVTSNRTYRVDSQADTGGGLIMTNKQGTGGVIADMDASDTLSIRVQVNGGTKVVDIAATNTTLSIQKIA